MLFSSRADQAVRNRVPYYPLFLDLRSRKTVVVGAGRVAERKVKSLLAAGSDVIVVAPRACPALRKLAAARKINWRARGYRTQDIEGAVLAFSATDSPEVERKVAADAARRGIPINCAAAPECGSFLVPAQMRRGSLQIAVSTGGASPVLARQLARRLKTEFGPQYDEWTRLLSRLRRRILQSVPAPQRPQLLERLASDRMLRWLQQGRGRQAAERAERRVEGWLAQARRNSIGPQERVVSQRPPR